MNNFDKNKLVSDIDFNSLKMSDIIEYIEDKHHLNLKNTLPVLSGYIYAILNVHGSVHLELFQLHREFNLLKTELEQHISREERILFPMVLEYEFDELTGINDEVINEIEAIESGFESVIKIISNIKKITNEFKVPDDGCATYHNAFRMLKELEIDFFDHISIEKNILFESLKSNKKG